MAEESMAEFHCRLATECEQHIGYVLDSIIRDAGIDALTGRKIDVGYLYKYADGSSLEYNVIKNTLRLLGTPK